MSFIDGWMLLSSSTELIDSSFVVLMGTEVTGWRHAERPMPVSLAARYGCSFVCHERVHWVSEAWSVSLQRTPVAVTKAAVAYLQKCSEFPETLKLCQIVCINLQIMFSCDCNNIEFCDKAFGQPLHWPAAAAGSFMLILDQWTILCRRSRLTLASHDLSTNARLLFCFAVAMSRDVCWLVLRNFCHNLSVFRICWYCG